MYVTINFDKNKQQVKNFNNWQGLLVLLTN